MSLLLSEQRWVFVGMAWVLGLIGLGLFVFGIIKDFTHTFARGGRF